MTPERWQRAKELFHAALERQPEERAEFLREACHDHPESLAQVLSLLENHRLDGFIEAPAIQAVARQLARDDEASAALDEAGGPAGLVDGKYALERVLGEGGMGVVHLARNEGLGRPVAVKLIQPEASLVARFAIEAAALGRLKHPGIVDVVDYGIDRGSGEERPYLVMEYLEGRTLARALREDGALTPSRALPVLSAVAAALDFAHGAGVLHCDLKPANVFLTPGGAKILDFGLARLLDRPLSGATAHGLAGTPAYMAPELRTGEKPNRASDLYALGVLAYEVLTGATPFAARPLELTSAYDLGSPPPPSARAPSVPAEVDRPVLALLASDPQQRPASAREAVEAIRRALVDAGRREWRRREGPRRLALAALLAAAGVAGSAAAGRMPAVRDLEARLLDVRHALRPRRPPDARLLILSVDEASLTSDPRPLAERADEFGLHLERALARGAQAVAIDFVLPEAWSHSSAFSGLLVRNAERITLAALSAPSGVTVGAESTRGLTAAVLGPERTLGLFGFVNLDEDPDGIVRRARLSFPDRAGGRRDSWARHAARRLLGAASGDEDADGSRFLIDHSLDWSRLPRLSWKDVPGTLERDPSAFRGRLLLVGGDLLGSGDDYHRLPPRGGKRAAVSGVVLQALIVSTILEGRPVRELSPAFVLGLVGICGGAMAAAVLQRPSLRRAILPVAGVLALPLLAGVLLFQWRQLVVPIAAWLLAMLAVLGLALALRARLPPFPEP